MIVPEERFLWVSALTLVPAAVAAALIPALAGLLSLVALANNTRHWFSDI